MRLWLLLWLAPLVWGCGGPRTGAERLRHAEERAMTAERALDRANAALEKLEPDEAESLISDAKRALSDPDIGAYPDHQLLTERLDHAEKGVLAARIELNRRDVERRVRDRTTKVEAAAKALGAALEKLRDPQLGSSEVRAAKSAVDDLKDALDVDDDRVKNDAGYAALAKGLIAALAGQRDEIALGERVVALKEGPLAKGRAAGEAAAKAAGEEDASAKLALYTEARQSYRACADGLKSALAESPKLKARAVVAQGQDHEQALEAIEKSCAKEAQALDQTIAKLEKAAKLAAAAKAKAEADAAKAKAKAEAAKAKAEAAKAKAEALREKKKRK